MFADQIQNQQVLVNLMRNALQSLRATAAHQCSIRIATGKLDDDRIAFSVSDNGPGATDRSAIRWFFHSTPPGGRAVCTLTC